MESRDADRRYNTRALVPDFQAYFDRYAETSAAARAALDGPRDLAYGPDARERLDLFLAGNGAPLAVFFHGGYWRQFSKDDFSYVARGLVPLGVSVAVVSYALAPETRLDAIVAQARRSVAWLAKNAETYGYDAGRIVAYGHSAGGHLAAMCAVATPLRALVALSGIFDLAPLLDSYVNEWLRLDPGKARALSPLHLAPACALPIYAVYGGNDPRGFAEQVPPFLDAWRAFGCDATAESAPADNHFSLCERLIDPTDPLNARIAALATTAT